jgi:hypothetical protein
MAGEDENTCKQFIKKFNFMMIIFFLIVLMVAGFTVAIIFTLKKKANTCTKTCMEGEKCNCPKCISRFNSEILLDNENLGSDCGYENYSELDYRTDIISSENFINDSVALSKIGTDMQTVTIGAELKQIVYTTNNITDAKVTNLPLGVNSVFKNNKVIISGKPSNVGRFIYNVILMKDKKVITKKIGVINVVPLPTPRPTTRPPITTTPIPRKKV